MIAQKFSAPLRWGCVHARPRAAHNRQQLCRASGGESDDWKKELAKATGRRYKPLSQKERLLKAEQEWTTSVTYDEHGRKVSTDGNGADEDGTGLTQEDWGALLLSDDDSDDDFDDYKGVVKDEEIFNINSGWSIQDHEGEVKKSKRTRKPKKPQADEGYDAEEDKDTSRFGVAAKGVLKSVPGNVLKALEQQQIEADDFNRENKALKGRRKAERAKLGSMRIITGSAAGKRLASPPGEGTRPMMEKVRGAVFSMVGSLVGSQPLLPPGSRWLDLFAGTGAVGIEALSRGCEQCTFIEMDPTVAKDSLTRNLNTCNVASKATVLSLRAEDYLKNARNGGRYRKQAFDFISVCPPYEAVSYEELFDLLDGSPLVHQETVVVVEYPKRLGDKIRDSLGPLHKVRDKRYGRTFVAVYGPAE